MRTMLYVACLLAVGLVAPGVTMAAGDAATVTCKDGTTATGGRGACHGHGGVLKAPKASKSEDAAPAMVTCKDGTSSKGGRGACRGHGGIAKGESAPAPAATGEAATPPPPVTHHKAAAPTRSAAAPAAGGTKTASSSDPTGAIARCKDGAYSHASGHRGACSRHGGVAEWLDGSAK
jgi:hypothetical protein